MLAPGSKQQGKDQDPLVMPRSPAPQSQLLSLVDSNPAFEEMQRLTTGASSVTPDNFAGFVRRFGFSFLTPEAIDAIFTITAPHGNRLLSLFTGLGYAEGQLAARGMDVIGFDKTVHEHRWLPHTYEGPARENIRALSDRPLFLSFPDWDSAQESAATSTLREYRMAGGTIAIVVSERRQDKHAFGCHREFFDELKMGTQLIQLDLPAWPTLEILSMARRAPATFEPLLTAYRLPA